MYLVFRIIIALVFIISGFEKIIHPYQNFLYVIQSYEIIPSSLEEIIAQIFPWLELLLGVFLLLGLWLKHVILGVLVLIVSFIILVGQALIRSLPISECGCFGEMISLPLYVVMIMDSILLLITVFLFRNISQSKRYSLDHFFESN